MSAAMFKVGDRVQLAERVTAQAHEPVGTVTGFVPPGFADLVEAPDDVLVRWDLGPELALAPVGLTLAAD